MIYKICHKCKEYCGFDKRIKGIHDVINDMFDNKHKEHIMTIRDSGYYKDLENYSNYYQTAIENSFKKPCRIWRCQAPFYDPELDENEEVNKSKNGKETLVICPKCKNKTLHISKENKFCICINVECIGKFRREDIDMNNFIDGIGYSW